ncbi:MAG: secondary thiamine-phosphate synthase enzyme YjbQ [Spirochaetes bacterium]|nr:secondary thiamine-phosphate synthase enzyme YjbQ [Spirochaetota bacterium]
MAESITVQSRASEELIDITGQIRSIIERSGITDGVCLVYTPHTTAAITINENADPAVRKDMIKGLRHLKFDEVIFSHAEGNSPAHLKSSLIGCSEMVIIENGRLCLGTWQGIYFCEFDGPRTRSVLVKFVNQT